jgi:hypothetical protein
MLIVKGVEQHKARIGPYASCLATQLAPTTRISARCSAPRLPYVLAGIGRQLTEILLAADELAERSDETLGQTSFAKRGSSVGS